MAVWVSHQEWGSTHGRSRNAYYIGKWSEFVVCHHTPDQDGMGDFNTAVEEMQSIERGHVRNGWGGVGYTYVVSGKYIFEGRTFGWSGAHAPGANSNSVGIAFLLDARDREPTAEEWNTAAEIANAGVDQSWLVPDFQTTGHKDWVATECPSGYIYPNLGKLRLAMVEPLKDNTPPVQEYARKIIRARRLPIYV